MKSLKSLGLTSAFLLTGGIALAAAPPNAAMSQHAKTPPQTREYQSQNMNNNGKQANTQGAQHCVIGTVNQVSGSSIVISHKYDGQQKTSSFQVQPRTKKEGNITNGERVAVYYDNVNNQHVATMVKAEPLAS